MPHREAGTMTRDELQALAVEVTERSAELMHLRATGAELSGPVRGRLACALRACALELARVEAEVAAARPAG
jgi:hypothetical protein